LMLPLPASKMWGSRLTTSPRTRARFAANTFCPVGYCLFCPYCCPFTLHSLAPPTIFFAIALRGNDTHLLPSITVATCHTRCILSTPVVTAPAAVSWRKIYEFFHFFSA
jgi:hypothetical protein